MRNDVLCTECGRPVHDSVTICDTCCDEFVALLWSVPGIVADLQITAARMDRVSNGRVGGKSAEAPMPVRLTGRVVDEPWRDTTRYPYERKASDDHAPHERQYHALVEALVEWGRTLATHAREQIPYAAAGLHGLVLANRDARNAHAGQPLAPASNIDELPSRRAPFQLAPVTHAEISAVWMATNSHLIRLMPAAHEMITELTHVITSATTVIDRRPELRYVSPCPSCNHELRAETGQQWVRCARCDTQHEVAKVTRDALRKVEDKVFTMAQIGRYLELMDIRIPRQTLHSWHYRGRIQPRGWVHTDPSSKRQTITHAWIHRDDPPVFRLGDVLRIAERHR